jgi:hypothetical protein
MVLGLVAFLWLGLVLQPEFYHSVHETNAPSDAGPCSGQIPEGVDLAAYFKACDEATFL